MTLTTIEDNSACVLIKMPQKLHELLLSYGFEVAEIKDFTQFRYNMHNKRLASSVRISIKVVEIYGNGFQSEKVEDIAWWEARLYPKKKYVKGEDYQEDVDEEGNFLIAEEFSGEEQESLIEQLQKYYKPKIGG